MTHGIYLIFCDFNECFKTIGFFKMPSVSYLDKNERILEDSMGGDSLPRRKTRFDSLEIGNWVFGFSLSFRC